MSDAAAQGPRRFFPGWQNTRRMAPAEPVRRQDSRTVPVDQDGSLFGRVFSVTIGNDTAEIAFEGALRRLKHPLASIERLRHFRQPLNPLIREHASLKTPVPVP